MGYQASAALECFIVDAAPLHYAVEDAPSTYDELCDWFGPLMAGDPIPVYNGGSTHTMYSKPEINHAFRAYHDGIHLIYELGFSLDDEKQVCEVQLEHMRQHQDEYEFTAEDYAVVVADIVGQAMYYDKHKKYVNDQRRFVASCLERGILATIEQGNW